MAPKRKIGATSSIVNSQSSQNKQKRVRTAFSLIKVESENGSVDKHIFTNCKPQWFLMDGKTKLVLTEMQIESVKQIGFGGLLDLRLTKLPFGIIPFLVQHFDPNSRIQQIPNSSNYVITFDDVKDILGLPLNPSKSIKLPRNVDDGIVSEWKTLVGLEGNCEITAKHLLNLFPRYPEGGDIFKKLFVVYAVAVLLWPLHDFKVRKTLLTFVEDVAVIPTHDWCSFVLDILCDSVDKVHKGGETVNGCVLILLAAFCYRYPFQGRYYPKSHPLIKHLTDEVVLRRLRNEKEVGFGNSPADFTGLPISHTFKDWCLRDEVVGGTKDNQGDEVDDASNGKFLILPLNEFPSDEELREHAKDDVRERSLFKALMCSRLVLTDLNLIRDDILHRVTDLNAKKTFLIKSLEKRRKKALNKNEDKDDGNNKKLMKRRKSVARTKRPASKKN